jgi:hypothetical protein
MRAGVRLHARIYSAIIFQCKIHISNILRIKKEALVIEKTKALTSDYNKHRVHYFPRDILTSGGET